MKIIFIIIFNLLVNQAYALRDISPQAFSLRVAPSLNSIQNDFFHILNQFPDFPKELPSLVSEFYKHHEAKLLLPLECPRNLTPQCYKEIKDLKAFIDILYARLDSVLLKLRPTETNHLNPQIGIKFLGNASNILWNLKSELELTSFLLDAGLTSSMSSLDIIRRLDQVRSELSLGMLQFIPPLYYPEFNSFYFEFIHPIRINQTHSYLKQNVRRLDFTLNLFVQSLTKRNKKTPEGSNQYLQLMHMRWNGILRFYK